MKKLFSYLFCLFLFEKKSTVFILVAVSKNEYKNLKPGRKYYTSSTSFMGQNRCISTKNGDIVISYLERFSLPILRKNRGRSPRSSEEEGGENLTSSILGEIV